MTVQTERTKNISILRNIWVIQVSVCDIKVQMFEKERQKRQSSPRTHTQT